MSFADYRAKRACRYPDLQHVPVRYRTPKRHSQSSSSRALIFCRPPLRTTSTMSTSASTGIRGHAKQQLQPQQQLPSKSSKPNNNNNKTLGHFLRYFEGMVVAAELKTGKILRGTLDSAESDMTLVLSDVTLVSLLGSTNNPTPSSTDSPPLAVVQIRGSHVRYIHFLADSDADGTTAAAASSSSYLDLAQVIKRGMDRERSASQKYQRGVRR